MSHSHGAAAKEKFVAHSLSNLLSRYVFKNHQEETRLESKYFQFVA